MQDRRTAENAANFIRNGDPEITRALIKMATKDGLAPDVKNLRLSLVFKLANTLYEEKSIVASNNIMNSLEASFGRTELERLAADHSVTHLLPLDGRIRLTPIAATALPTLETTSCSTQALLSPSSSFRNPLCLAPLNTAPLGSPNSLLSPLASPIVRC